MRYIVFENYLAIIYDTPASWTHKNLTVAPQLTLTSFCTIFCYIFKFEKNNYSYSYIYFFQTLRNGDPEANCTGNIWQKHFVAFNKMFKLSHEDSIDRERHKLRRRALSFPSRSVIRQPSKDVMQQQMVHIASAPLVLCCDRFDHGSSQVKREPVELETDYYEFSSQVNKGHHGRANICWRVVISPWELENWTTPEHYIGTRIAIDLLFLYIPKNVKHLRYDAKGQKRY